MKWTILWAIEMHFIVGGFMFSGQEEKDIGNKNVLMKKDLFYRIHGILLRLISIKPVKQAEQKEGEEAGEVEEVSEAEKNLNLLADFIQMELVRTLSRFNMYGEAFDQYKVSDIFSRRSLPISAMEYKRLIGDATGALLLFSAGLEIKAKDYLIENIFKVVNENLLVLGESDEKIFNTILDDVKKRIPSHVETLQKLLKCWDARDAKVVLNNILGFLNIESVSISNAVDAEKILLHFLSGIKKSLLEYALLEIKDMLDEEYKKEIDLYELSIKQFINDYPGSDPFLIYAIGMNVEAKFLFSHKIVKEKLQILFDSFPDQIKNDFLRNLLTNRIKFLVKENVDLKASLFINFHVVEFIPERSRSIYYQHIVNIPFIVQLLSVDKKQRKQDVEEYLACTFVSCFELCHLLANLSYHDREEVVKNWIEGKKNLIKNIEDLVDMVLLLTFFPDNPPAQLMIIKGFLKELQNNSEYFSYVKMIFEDWLSYPKSKQYINDSLKLGKLLGGLFAFLNQEEILKIVDMYKHVIRDDSDVQKIILFIDEKQKANFYSILKRDNLEEKAGVVESHPSPVAVEHRQRSSSAPGIFSFKKDSKEQKSFDDSSGRKSAPSSHRK